MTASCTTPSVQRPTEDICPPWCAGHLDGYQAWETLTDGNRERYHAERSVIIGQVSVAATQTEDAAFGMLPPGVEIADNTPGMTGSMEMSDDEAHELGMAILGAADKVRRYRLAQVAHR